MKDDIDFGAFLAQPRQRPSELEQARRGPKGAVKSGPPGGSDAYADAVFSELRALRSEVSSLRDLLTGPMQAEGPPIQDEILTRGQAAKVLRVCAESVTKLVRDEGLPCKRVGKEYRFLRSQVVAWLASRGSIDLRQLSGHRLD